MTFYPRFGQIRAQTLHIDVVAIKAHLGNKHQRLAFEPFTDIFIIAHVETCQQIRLGLQTFGHLNGIGMVGIGILKDVTYLLLVQEKDIGTLIEVEHSIDRHISIFCWRHRVEIEVVAVQAAEVLRGEGDLSEVFI